MLRMGSDPFLHISNGERGGGDGGSKKQALQILATVMDGEGQSRYSLFL
jgi:hypothetical protein